LLDISGKLEENMAREIFRQIIMVCKIKMGGEEDFEIHPEFLDCERSSPKAFCRPPGH
jgi:hypothetical protein